MSTNPLLSTPRERVVEIYRGEDEARLVSLQEKLDEAFEAEQTAPKRAGIDSKATANAYAEQLDEAKAQARERAIKVTLREVPHRVVRQIQDEHPARKGNELDELRGYDRDAFERALIKAMMVSPEVTEEQFEEFADSAATSAWSRLLANANEIQFGDLDLGKGSSAASALTRARRRASTQPDDTE